MSITSSIRRFRRLILWSVTCLLLGTGFNASAEANLVTTLKDENGWKLLVDGEPFYVKGVVWSYTPPGENYTYAPWNENDDTIKKILDIEFAQLKAANVNAVRLFSNMPPKWVTYVYEEYGIMTLINPLMGRYGAMINGIWKPQTDYSDPATRETLIKESVDIVNKYKDVKGVLMFAFGNENNYGLSWSASFEIENLPEGEKQAAKAKHLYSLWGDVIAASKEVHTGHPYSIVNGDIQYIDLIAKYIDNMDIMGSNVYRGASFTNMWEEVDKKLDKPIVFMEFGSDAFNAREFREDGTSQAYYLREQWKEMYNNAYGKGFGNSVGGWVFQWRDEWWKYKQIEFLEEHNTNASWSNQAYLKDWAEGQNNMNEEWFGITRIGAMDATGYYPSEPRMSVDMLTEVWGVDVFNVSEAQVNEVFDNLKLDIYEVRSDIVMLRGEGKKRDAFQLESGSFRMEGLVQGFDGDITEQGEDGLTFKNGEMLDLNFTFEPNKQLRGDFTINILNNVAESNFEFRYGDRGLPVAIIAREEIGADAGDEIAIPGVGASNVIAVDLVENLEGRERVEIYDFQAIYDTPGYTLNTFYHVPRYHLGDKGDFFGLVAEATDMKGMDIWNAKAPFGVEYIGKKDMKGLTVIAGPEIYWGANPMALFKYDFGGGKYTFMHAEDIARRDDSSSSTEATVRQTRKTTITSKHTFGDGSVLELGGIMAGTEKIDEEYIRLEGDRVYSNTIELKDTLGIKGKYAFDLLGTRSYVAAQYMGLVADAGNPLREFYTELPYSGLGNKKELELGTRFNIGTDIMIYPRVLARDNIVNSNPLVDPDITGSTLTSGAGPRNRDADPFAVLDNREARSAEVYFTYDPTGSTFFYDWDNDMREDADFAFNAGLTVTEYRTAADSELFFFEEASVNAPFGVGLPAETVWLAKSKMVFNFNRDMKMILRLEAGRGQSTGDPDGGSTEFYGADTKMIIHKRHIIEGNLKKDKWGPYDFERQFNLVYPWQFMLDYSFLLDALADEEKSSRVGVRTLFRTLDERSDGAFYLDGFNDYMFELQFYLKLMF